MNNFSVSHDNEIAYEIIRSPRIKKQMVLKVHPDGRVAVHAPAAISDKKAHNFVLAKSEWIKKQLVLLQQKPVSKQHQWSYNDGELHYYLGRQYPLQIIIDPLKRQTVNLLENTIQVCAQSESPARIRAILQAWYKYQAKKIFTERLQDIMAAVDWVDTMPVFSIRMMQSRWGSCSSKKTLSLNVLLMRAPMECIDYIIKHELCHFIEMNHGSRFYRLLETICPEWRSIKKQLDAISPVILTV